MFAQNQSGYPTFICRISDAARGFHPVASFLASQITSVQYGDALVALGAAYESVVGKALQVRLFISDAEDAQLNAFRRSKWLNQANYVTCFFPRRVKCGAAVCTFEQQFDSRSLQACLQHSLHPVAPRVSTCRAVCARRLVPRERASTLCSILRKSVDQFLGLEG